MVTPRKVHGEGVCVVCKNSIKKGEARHINSTAGQKKNLPSLLVLYGGIEIVEGVLCRSCERRVIALDASVTQFRKMCQDNLHLLNSKRGLTDITNTHSDRRHPPKKLLFSVPEICETMDQTSATEISFDEGLMMMRDSQTSVEFKTPVAIRKKPQATTSTPATQTVTTCISSPELSPIPNVDCNENITSSSHGPSKETTKHLDHPYMNRDSNQTNEKKTPKRRPSRLAKQHEASVSIFKDSLTSPDCDDFISDSEFADILSQLPQRSRQNFINCIWRHDSLKALIEKTVLSEVAKNCEFLKNRKHGKLSSLMTKDYAELKQFNWNDITFVIQPGTS